MKKFIALLLILVTTTVYAAPPTRQNNFQSGTTIRSDEVNTDFNDLFGYLQTGVEVLGDGAVDAVSEINDSLCTDGQILKKSSGSWACGTDSTDTSGADSVSIDSSAVTDPDFQDSSTVNFIDISNVVTAAIIDNSIRANHIKHINPPSDGLCATYDSATGNFEWATCGSGGSSIIFDIGDDGGNDSTALGEIATSGDTNNIITLNATDKMLIDMSQNWPTADTANAGDSATSFFSTGTLEVTIGGTGATSLTDGYILLGSGTAAITPLDVTTDGAIVIGDGTTDPTTLNAFTSSTGTLVHEYGGVEADVSAYTGLIGINSGTTSEVDTESELETHLGSLDVVTVTANDISSANLATLTQDEVGVGYNLFNTNPTISGQMIAPIIYSAAGSGTDLQIEATGANVIFGPLGLDGVVIDTANETITIGSNENTATITGVTTYMAVSSHKEDPGGKVDISAHRHSAAAGSAPIFGMFRSTGAEGAETAVANGITLGEVYWYGQDGTDYNEAAGIRAVVDGTVSANTIPTRLQFHTSATNELTEAMRIDSAQKVEVFSQLAIPQGTAPSTPNVSGEVVLDTNQISASQGTIVTHDGAQVLYVVTTTDTPANDEIPKYDSGTGTITWEADGGSGGGGGSTTIGSCWEQLGAGDLAPVGTDSCSGDPLWELVGNDDLRPSA